MAEEAPLTVRALSIFLVAASLGGCVDPEESFEAYNERARQVEPPPVPDAGAEAGACARPTPEQIAPEYVLTMSMALTPGQAFLSRGSASAELVGDELHVTLDLQWLDAGDRQTPVGDAFEFGPIIVDASGNATTAPKDFSMPPEANPVLCGLVASATTEIKGTFCAPPEDEPYARVACGAVEGTLHEPIEQDFAAAGAVFRVEAVDAGGDLPTTLIGCAGDPLVAPQCQ